MKKVTRIDPGKTRPNIEKVRATQQNKVLMKFQNYVLFNMIKLIEHICLPSGPLQNQSKKIFFKEGVPTKT